MANRFIQGKFNPPGNFELVTRDGGNPAKLVHIWRDQDFIWQPPQLSEAEVVSKAASSPGAIIQNKASSPSNPGDFEVLVLEGTNLVHYQKDNSSTSNPWTPANPFIVSEKATAEASFIQGNLGAASNNFEAVVLEGTDLVHYYKDNSSPGNPWQRTAVISSQASSAGCIIQSNLGASSNNFEVVVLEGSNLVHYYRDNSIPADGSPPSYSWSPKPTATISSQAVSSASLIQSDLGASHNNFEVVVLEEGGLGSQQANLVHYYRDNSIPADGSPPTYAWSPKPTATISTQSQGQVCLIQSDYGTPSIGNFEAIVLEGAEGAHSLDHYWRENGNDSFGPWNQAEVVARFPFDSVNDG